MSVVTPGRLTPAVLRGDEAESLRPDIGLEIFGVCQRKN